MREGERGEEGMREGERGEEEMREGEKEECQSLEKVEATSKRIAEKERGKRIAERSGVWL